MYLFYCLSIGILVYSLPALACMPRLLGSPMTAFAIPIVSALVIYGITTLLITLGMFSTSNVVLVALLLAGIAVVRVYRQLKKTSLALAWEKIDKILYVLPVILLFPFFIKLGTHGFDRGDEIYSWNFWAIQHFFSEPLDFSHTGAPYPQLFPKLLAFSYRLLGSIELQLPVKATLIVFPWALLTAIGMAGREVFLRNGYIYLLYAVYALWGVGLAQFFDDGYADPVMTSALGVSAALFWLSQRPHVDTPIRFYSVGVAVLAAWVCAHAKQAGLLWTGWALPLLLILAYCREKNRVYLIGSALALLGALLWVAGEGQQFHHNQGVLWLSMRERHLGEQLLYAMNQYFVHQPLLLGWFLLACWASQRDRILKQMFWIFLFPGWICWFMWGAYQLRLGQHLIAFAWLLIVARGVFPLSLWQKKYHQYQKKLLSAMAGVSVIIGVGLFIKEAYVEKGGMSLYEGGRQSLHRYFGKEVNDIYANVYQDPTLLLWVPSRYIYGLFYKHTHLTSPDYAGYPNYNKAAVIEELWRKEPDYVFTVSQAVIDGPASQRLSEVVQLCPGAFEKVSGPDNRFFFMTYKIRKDRLLQDPCLKTLVQADRFPGETQLLLKPHD